MGLFSRKERLLGIDISASAVKVVELNRNGQRFQVEAMAIEPLPEGVMEERNPREPDKVGAAIKRAVRASGSKLKQAAVAVPTSGVIVRTIGMPMDFGDEEIEANLQIEASQYIPFPLEEIYLDFQVLGRSKNDTSLQDVMIVACRKENVDLREAALAEADLKAAIVDVEGYALENTFELLSHEMAGAGEEQRIALVDVGASVTTLYVVQDGRVIYTREQSFGGEQLTAAIADTYDMPRDRAELAKRSGELSEDYAGLILAPYLETAAEQIGNALQFFFSSSAYNAIDGVLLTGGVASIAGLDRAVTDLLGVPAAVGNPFDGMGSASRINQRTLERDGPAFAVACGLAMRSFDQP